MKASGFKGVYTDNDRPGHWRASIRLNGKPKNLGRFKTKEQAAAAYALAVIQNRDEHATYGTAR